MRTRIETPPPTWLRAACLAAFAALLVQIFFLDEPRLARDLANATWDKLLHAAGFGALALLYWMGLGFRAPLPGWILVTLIGALDEFHQIFIPTRTADVLDVVADAVGAAVVILLLQRLSQAPGTARAIVAAGVPAPIEN
jgi:VanZ family protein